MTRRETIVFSAFAMSVFAIALMGMQQGIGRFETARNQAVEAVFSRLQDIERSLERDILLVQTSALRHFDGLARAVIDLRQTRNRLKRGTTDIVNEGEERLRRLYARYVGATERRIALVERIKARQALVSNSMGYLPTALENVLDTADDLPVVESLAQSTTRTLLMFASAGKLEHQNAATKNIAELEARAAGTRAAEPARVLALHGHNILAERTAQKVEIQRFFASESLSFLGDLLNAHLADYNAQHAQGQRIYQVFTAITAFLVIGLGYTLLSLRRAAHATRASRNQLLDAVESVPQAFALFDKDDRLLVWNEYLTEYFHDIRDDIRTGVTFETLVRHAAGRGQISDAEDNEEAWIRTRLARHTNPAGPFEIQCANGRCLEVRERRTREGGVVTTYTDITDSIRAARNLARREAELERAQELARWGSWAWEPETGSYTWSRQLYRIFGHEPDGFTPTLDAFLDAVHPSDRERVRSAIRGAHRKPGPRNDEFRIIRPDGTVCHIRSVHEVVTETADNPVLVTGVAHDVTDRKRVQEHLNRLFHAIEQSPSSVIITDAQGNIEYVNPKFVETTGYTPVDAIGQNPSLLKSGYTSDLIYQDLWETVSAGGTWRGELHNKKKDGSLFWEDATISPIKAPDGTVTHILAIKEDISVRKEYEERLLRQANFDELTELPNRVLALDRLSQALARAEREKRIVTVMIVNLDDIKKINHTLGHQAGDQLLIEVSRRLFTCVRDGDTVARIEGDQFLIILPDLSLAVFAEVVAQKILSICAKPVTLAGSEVTVSASIGLTVYPSDGADPHVLLRNAHAALNRAKEMGGNSYRFFTPKMNEGAVRRLAEENLLRHALERGELNLVFQPLVDARKNKIIGAEALLRWTNPELGPVSPEQFIPMAEKTGLIVPIGDWVLREACRTAKGWRDRTGIHVQMAVNVSFRQFKGGTLSETVAKVLEETGLDASTLELEITERILVEEAPETSANLKTLSDMGIRLSMDDFGTGYSSLSYLKRFPFDVIKVDRSFVRDVTEDPDDAMLTSAIIAMGRTLGLEIIAEGVETPEQLGFLRDRGCDFIQGYYLSRPLPADEFEALLIKSEENGGIRHSGR